MRERTASPASLDLLDPRLKPLCVAYLEAAQVPGASISVVHADRGYHLAHGVKSLLTREPVTADTAFNIGSCSKAFVSTAVASLVADGLLAWDDPVARHVPELQLYDEWITRHVTLRDLSANRLGLARVGLTDAGIAPDVPVAELLQGLRHTAPIHPFRDRFTYVNLGHVANALVVGRVTGQGFLATLRERVLAPLGMDSTWGGATAPAVLSDIAAAHCPADAGVVLIDAPFTDQRLGSGGMFVSGRDALQWLRLHLNGGRVDGRQVIPREALLETHRAHTPARPGQDLISLFYPGAHMAAYGLGWAVSDLEGQPLICHSGVDYGAAAMTLLLPRQGIGIAVYGNLQMQGPVPTAYAIAATLLGLPARDWRAYFEAAAPVRVRAGSEGPVVAGTEPPDLAPYVGRYRHVVDGLLSIERDGGALKGVIPRGHRLAFTLQPVGEHRFRLKFIHPEWQLRGVLDAPELRFTVEAGRVLAAELFMGPVGQVFQRDV